MKITDENEEYNLPCPYDSSEMCVQMPCGPEDDNFCGECPVREKVEAYRRN